MNAVQKAFHSGEDYENCYIFAPSISRRETVGRQTYYVRRYFRGGKDFERTMEQLAVDGLIISDIICRNTTFYVVI